MSDYILHLILGVVQGLTEFLPVSSSGHLELVKMISGDHSLGEQSLMTTVVLHFATALASIIVFWKDIVGIVSDFFKAHGQEARKFVVAIVISMIPAVIVGLVWEDAIELLFSGQLLLVGICLLVTAVLLYFADRKHHLTSSISYGKAFIIGVAQAIAILPGISRSGATIASSILLGVDREKAARFSFLMVIPLIFGKIAKDLLSGDLSTSTVNEGPLFIGFLAALISGYLACKWMIAIVKRSQLKYFALYCTIVGLVCIILHF